MTCEGCGGTMIRRRYDASELAVPGWECPACETWIPDTNDPGLLSPKGKEAVQ